MRKPIQSLLSFGRRCIIMLFCIGIYYSSHANPEAIILSKGRITFDKSKSIKVLAFRNNSTFEQVVNRKFKPYNSIASNELEAHANYWAKYHFKCKDPGDYYFYFGKGEYITVHVLRQDGTIQTKEIGEFTPRSESDVKYISKSARIGFEKDEELTVFVHISNETNFAPRISLFVQNAEAYQHDMLFKRLGIQGLFHAAIWMMIFYTLFLWISIMDRAYLYYALYMFALSFTFFLHDQIHYQFLTQLAEYPKAMHFLEIAAAHISLVLYFMFMQKLVNTKTLVPFLHKVITFWIVFKVLSLPVLIWINTYNFKGDILLNYIFLIDFVLLFMTCIILLFKKDMVAIYFAIGSLLLAIFGLVTIVSWFGIFSISWAEHMIQIGVITQIIFFSMGLGLKTRRDANLVFELQKKNEDLVGQLRKKVNEQEKTLRLFMRYVPEPVVAKALNKSEESMFDGEIRYVSAMFCDVRSFTTISEDLEPQKVVAFLNDFYSIMTVVIKKYGGSVNQFIGDEIFAVFGAPLSTTNNEQRSVLAALEMIDKVQYLNDKYQAEFKRPIQLGIGMHYGEVVAGNLGSEEKMGYSVSGDTVNTAKRLEGLTKGKPDSIVISEQIYSKVAALVVVEPMDEVFLKGKKNTIKTYRVLRKK